MKRIELFEKAIEEKAKDITEYGINPTMFWAYRNSILADNELMDFGDVIWEKDIEEIAIALKKFDITEFTISSTFSGLISTLEEFEKWGITMVGLTKVNAIYKDFTTGKNMVLPAIKMKCN